MSYGRYPDSTSRRGGEVVRAIASTIDDLTGDDLVSTIGSRWRLVTDRVMGGVSEGSLVRETVSGRPALRLRGDVSLENNGGFVQMVLDLAADRRVIDASAWTGIELDVIGNDQEYGVHLRTDAIERPWQSYRQSFRVGGNWRTVQLPFAAFVTHRIDTPLDLRRLRRIGVVAIGRAFSADLAISGLRFFR
jgi:hypothetical protein